MSVLQRPVVAGVDPSPEAARAEATLGPGRVSWEVRDGNPVEVLRAEGAGAQLLVVGSRGSGGLSGLLLGSTAGGVVLDPPCPVVVLPDGTAVRARDRRSVVVGVEGRPGDQEVLAVAFAEALAGRYEKDPDVDVREVVVRDRTARALVAAALSAQLPVVGHRRRPLARLGSTTYGVLHRAGCPVAVVPLAETPLDGSR